MHLPKLALLTRGFAGHSQQPGLRMGGQRKVFKDLASSSLGLLSHNLVERQGESSAEGALKIAKNNQGHPGIRGTASGALAKGQQLAVDHLDDWTLGGALSFPIRRRTAARREEKDRREEAAHKRI